MRLKVVATLFVGCMLAVLSGLATFSYTRGLEAEVASVRKTIQAFGETAALPVARKDIARGTVVTAADFTTLILPVSAIPGQALDSLPVPAEGQVLIAMEEVRPGGILLRQDLALADAASRRDLSLAGGARLYRLSPANLGDYQATLRKGHLIDLYWSRSLPRGETEARLLGNGLKLFALPEAGAGTEILIEVTPADVARILAAAGQGGFHITPSSGPLPEGAAEVLVSAADLADLPLAVRAGGSARPGAEAPVTDVLEVLARAAGAESKPKVCVTAVIRAGHRSFIEIPC